MAPGEAIDLSLRVFQSQGWALLRTTALPSVLCLAAVLFVMEYVLPSFGTTRAPGDIGAQVLEALATLALGVGLGGPLFLLGLSFSSGVVVCLVSDHMLGASLNVASASRRARSALPRLLGLNVYELLVGWSGVLLGFLLLMLSALFPESTHQAGMWPAATAGVGVVSLIVGFGVLPLVLVRHSLAAPAIVLEGLKPAAAAKRSHELLRGTAWVPWGYGAVWMLVTLIAFLMLVLVVGAVTTISIVTPSESAGWLSQFPIVGAVVARTIEYLPWYLAIWALVPVWCTAVTVLYYERRVRAEGFDIEALAQHIWRSDQRRRFEV